MRTALLSILALLCTGCANYEYDLLSPPALHQHIGKAAVNVPVSPLVYRLQTVDNHLFMSIQNPTTDPIYLMGDRSVIVDQDGASHPLTPQTIAPGSYVVLVLPPDWDDDYYYDAGPYWYGGGGYYGWRRRRGWRGGYYGYGYGYGYYSGPSWVVAYPAYGPGYFDWTGETDVHMSLTFTRLSQLFTHSFVFHRMQMK